MRDWKQQPWSGVYPATLCPFHEDQSIDDEGLATYIEELASEPGINGLTCNGHTGEIMSLKPEERHHITQIVSRAVDKSNKQLGRDVKVITGVSAEGSAEAIEHALAAKEAGADAILLMPPHHWLRFGRSSETAVGFIQDVAQGSGIDIIIHQYPAWTKAGYSLDEMLEMVTLPEVVMIKMGTRDMSRWLYDYQQLKMAAPQVSIVTCHDEFLLPTLLEGADGALIGFAGFVPKLMVEVVEAALNGEYQRAKEAQKTVEPLSRLVYNFGEPGCGAHQRMKVARWLMGRFPSPHFRLPIRPMKADAIERIREQLRAIDYPVVR